MRGFCLRSAFLFLAALNGGCAPRTAAIPPPEPLPELPRLPELTVELQGPVTPAPPSFDQPQDPLAAYPPGSPVTLTARNTDLGTLIVALAEAAGVDLILDPTIQS